MKRSLSGKWLAVQVALGLDAACGLAVEFIPTERRLLARNLIFDAAILIVMISAFFLRSRIVDIAAPRRKWVMPALAALTAMVSLWPILQLPWFADDWQLLQNRGARPLLFTIFGHDPGELWFRPVGWAPWWFFDKLGESGVIVARVFTMAVFATAATLSGPALRRCGIPKGVAGAASVLFAAQPAVVETLAWATNLYAAFACLFSIACIATLPVRNCNIKNMILPSALALAAFLSKEDSYLLPIWAAAVFARFRWKYAISGARKAAPLFVIVLLVASIRFLVLRGVGAYANLQTGESVLVSRAIEGPLTALQTEFPGRYILVARTLPYAPAVRALFYCIPVLLFAWGGASAVARRCVSRGMLIVIITIAPVAPLLPIGTEIECARWLLMPSLGLSAAVAAMFAGGPLRRASAWIPAAAFIILSFLVTHNNLRAWIRSADAMQAGTRLAREAILERRDGERLWITGLPWMVNGAYCFNCSVPSVYQRIAPDRKLQYFECVDTGEFDAMIEIDLKRGAAVDWLSGDAHDADAADGSLNFNFSNGIPPDSGVRAVNLNLLNINNRLSAHAGLAGHLLFPVMRLDPGSRIQVETDARVQEAAAGAAREAFDGVFLTYRANGKFTRRMIPRGTPVSIPQDARRARIDLVVPFGVRIEISKFKITVSRGN